MVSLKTRLFPVAVIIGLLLIAIPAVIDAQGLQPLSAAQGDLVCEVNYVNRNDWGSGATIDITITNQGDAAIEGWTLRWTFPGNQQIANGWSATYAQRGADVSAVNLSQKNDPHGAATWGTGNLAPDWNLAADTPISWIVCTSILPPLAVA